MKSRLLAFGAGLLAAAAVVGAVAVVAAASRAAASPGLPVLLLGAHLALAAVVGGTARVAERAPLVPAVPAVAGSALLTRSLRAWVELPVEADQGLLLALAAAILAVAAVRWARVGRITADS